MKKTVLYTAMVAALGITALASVSAQAANVNTGDTLTITTGVPIVNTSGTTTGVSGSWFGMDTNSNGSIQQSEKTPLAQGTTGLVIGVTTTAGASHGGAPTAGDTNAITKPWLFNSSTGSDYVTTAVTGGTTTGLNFSGWTVTWNGIPAINMGGGAWGTGYSNGVANFVWDGVYGHSYILDYHATVPVGDPSNFGGTKYALHLEGFVQAAAPVPVPAAVWLLGSGLVGLVGVARRRKNVA